MDINTFIFSLKDKFREKDFWNIKITHYYNVYDKHYLIHVTAKRNDKDYVCGYSISEELLDNLTIRTMVNRFLNLE